jgi:hypothetical protein
MKKLYSFRIDLKLLEALRNKADEEGTTVSELMHRLLSEALGIADEKVSPQELKSLLEKLKDEVKAELKNEMQL